MKDFNRFTEKLERKKNIKIIKNTLVNFNYNTLYAVNKTPP